MKRAGVDVLVSMLPVDEAAELGLSPEAELCGAIGIAFRSFPIPDRETPPSTASFSRFVEDLRAEAHAGRTVALMTAVNAKTTCSLYFVRRWDRVTTLRL